MNKNKNDIGTQVLADKAGFVIAAQELVAVEIGKARAAALKVGFDDELVRDVRPRNAFIRAARQLVRQGVLETGNRGVLADKIDDDSEIKYQFSKRVVTNGEARYPGQAVICFDKKSEQITVEGLGDLSPDDRKRIHETVSELFKRAGYTMTTQDLNNLIDRVFSSVTRRIMLRPAVYFVPLQFQALVFKVREFFAELGIQQYVLTVGLSESWAVEDVFQSAARDIKKNIAELRAEIASLKDAKDDGGDPAFTGRIARNRIKQLARDLQNYRDIARSLHRTAGDMLNAAGDSGQTLYAIAQGPDALVQALNAGKPVDPLAALLTATATDNAKIMALAAKVNGAANAAAFAQLAVGGLEAPKLVQAGTQIVPQV